MNDPRAALNLPGGRVGHTKTPTTDTVRATMGRIARVSELDTGRVHAHTCIHASPATQTLGSSAHLDPTHAAVLVTAQVWEGRRHAHAHPLRCDLRHHIWGLPAPEATTCMRHTVIRLPTLLLTDRRHHV